MIPQGHKLFIMDYYRRQNFGQFYGGQFRPYWLPYNQPGQPQVLVVQVPFPVRMDNDCVDPDQPTVSQKSKSRAQRNRDFTRRQTFIEKKSVCAIMPFYELEGQNLTNEIQDSMDGLQDVKLTSKLRKATQTIKDLEFENKSLMSLNDKLGVMVNKEKQRSEELSTQLVAAKQDKAASINTMDTQERRDTQKLILSLKEDLKNYKEKHSDAEKRLSAELEKVQSLEQKLRQQELDNSKSYKQDYFDAEVRWSAELEKVQALHQKVRKQAMMLDELRRYKQDYYDAEVRWSDEFDKVQSLRQKVRQQAMMLDNMKKSAPMQVVGSTCPYDYSGCNGPVTRNISDAKAVGNQETPVLSSVFPVNSSKQKPRHKSRKKQSKTDTK